MKRLSIGKAWEESSRFLSKELRLVVPVALAFFAIPVMLARWASPSEQVAGGIGMLISVLVLLAALVGYMTIALLAVGWSGSVGAAISRALARLPGLFLAFLIVAIPIVIVAVFAVAWIVAGAGITDPAQLTPESMAQLPGFGALAIIIFLLVLIIGARLFPISAVAAAETANPFAQLARSWRLTKGNFGRLLLVFALLMIAGGIARMAVIAVVGSIMTLAAGDARPFNLSALVIALAVGIVVAAIWAIGAAFAGRIYAQLSAGEATVPEVKREE